MVSMHARRKLGSDEAVNYGNVAADALANTLVDRWTGVHKTQAALAAQDAKREAAIAHAGSKAGRRQDRGVFAENYAALRRRAMPLIRARPASSMA